MTDASVNYTIYQLHRQLAITLTGELLGVVSVFFIGFLVLCLSGMDALESPENGWWHVRELTLVPYEGTGSQPWEDSLNVYIRENDATTDDNPRLIRRESDLVLYQVIPSSNSAPLFARYVLITGPCFVLALICVVAFVIVASLALVRHQRALALINTLEAHNVGAETLFGNATHELKIPLMSIYSWSEAARTGLVDLDKACQSINQETDRMAVLVNQILKLSQADAGRIEPRPHHADLRELLYDAEQSISSEAHFNNVNIIINAPQPIICYFDLDLTYTSILCSLAYAVRCASHTVKLGCVSWKGEALVWITNDNPCSSQNNPLGSFEHSKQAEHGEAGIGMALALQCAKAQGFSLEIQPIPNGTLTMLKIQH